MIENIESASQVKYWALLDYIKEHDMTQKTPMFMEVKNTNQGQAYMEMSIGVL